MSLSPSDTVFKDLKQKGLALSEIAIVQVPEPEPVKQGIIKKLSSYVVGAKKTDTFPNRPLNILQIHYSAFIVQKSNSLFIYQYNFDQQAKRIDVQYVSSFTPQEEILQFFVCSPKHIQDKDFPILAKTKTGIVYINFYLKQLTIKEVQYIKFSNFITAVWMSDKQCLIAGNGEVSLYVINGGILRQKGKKQPLQLILDKNEKLSRAWAFGHVDQHQEATICICYSTITVEQNSNKNNHIRLKIKQFIRTLDGQLINAQQPNYVLQTQSLKFNVNFNIVQVGEHFCLQLSNQILIMKKKFGKYMLLDNLLQIMHGYKPILSKKGLIVSIGQNQLELNCIQFSDPKCNSRICDVIEFPDGLKKCHQNFRQIWPIIVNKQYTLIFVFINQNQIKLAGLIKEQPMIKMMSLAKKYSKDKLQMLQDMAFNLGINRTDFYLKLWSTSKKENADIYQYLIPCKDVSSIKKQLKSTLRQRTIQVSQMLKILQKISQINLANLKVDLTTKNLRLYLKNDFLRKKIKLNQMNKMLDHRVFGGIYNSSILDIVYDIARDQLDPIKPKFDPLHPSDNYHPVKQLKSLQSVFQQFKVLLLQDYKNFLKQFLAKFPNKILQVLHKFSFLLPNHPFEIVVQKPSKTNEPILQDPKPNNTVQPLWFQTVMVSEWQAEMTKQKILKQLFYDFQTSKITQTIDQFDQSLYATQNKLWKHGLITKSLQEYTTQLKTLNGIQLYLDVCQFANELSIASPTGDPKISHKIVNKLKQKNKLTQPDIHYCKLYASMHYFMLKNKIIPKNKLQISYLTSLKPQSLIALFFLENKQRKQHIFNDFKDLYQDKNQFCQVLTRFVQSQNCSRIQLQILMNQIIAKGHQFQQQNQDIINVLITGICMKVQLREELLILDVQEQEEDEEVGCLIDQIQLSKELALKVNRIKRIRLCKNIFQFFKLQRKTYKQLLDLEQKNEIFSLILSKFFQIREDQAREQELKLNIQDQQQINLQNPRNLLTVLIYLQENVYYSAQTLDIMLLFGLELILWKQFGIMKQIICDQNAFQTLGINREQFIKQLTMQALESIYRDPNIVYDQQTKQQIINILGIDPDDKTPLRIREDAKLYLVEIFTHWGLEVHPSDIHAISYQWKQQNRQEFMIDLVDNYVDKLDFKTFQEIFRLLQITDKESTQINIYTTQYVRYCDYYAKKLLQAERYRQVIEIIVFLLGFETSQRIDYAMLVESYLRMVIQLYEDNQDKGRKFIEFFVQKYDTPQQYSIRQLLQSQFDENALALWQRNPIIPINPQYCYDHSSKVACEVSLDDLWQIARAESEDSTEMYYNYFFLTMGLSNPKKGFANTLGISYNLQKITNLIMGGLYQHFQSNQNLWFVHYGVLEATFLFDAILGQASFNLQINLDNSDKKTKIQSILKQLRARKAQNQRNQLILNIITRLKVQLWNKNKLSARKDRYKRKLKQITQIQSERHLKQQKQSQNQVQEEKVEQPEVFLNWRKVQQQKKIISSMSQFLMSEKDLIDQVYDKNIQFSRLRPIENKKVNRQNCLSNLFSSKGNEKTDNIINMIKEGKYAQVGKFPKDLVIQAINKIYEQNPEKDYTEVIQILDEIKFGCSQKRQLFKIAKIFLATLPNQIRKTLFSLQFISKPINYDQQVQTDKSKLLYSELKPKIQQLIPNLNSFELKQLANLMNVILDSSQYSARVYLLKLLYLGQYCKFDSNSALMAYQCMLGMSEYPNIIGNNFGFIIRKMTHDKEMKLFVKQSLYKIMTQKQYFDIAQQIRNCQMEM